MSCDLSVQIFLRELISNASDALDKVRFLSLTDKSALSATEELSIKIKADKENNMLHITDTGLRGEGGRREGGERGEGLQSVNDKISNIRCLYICWDCCHMTVM